MDEEQKESEKKFEPQTYGLGFRIPKTLWEESIWAKREPVKLTRWQKLRLAIGRFRLWLAKKIAGYDFEDTWND